MENSKPAINPSYVMVNYSNRTVKSVIHDLLVKYGKTEIEYIIDQCVSEIEGDAQDKLLEFVRNIRDGKFHGHGFEHPDEPCNCNELAAADFLQNWRGLTMRALDVCPAVTDGFHLWTVNGLNEIRICKHCGKRQ